MDFSIYLSEISELTLPWLCNYFLSQLETCSSFVLALFFRPTSIIKFLFLTVSICTRTWIALSFSLLCLNRLQPYFFLKCFSIAMISRYSVGCKRLILLSCRYSKNCPTMCVIFNSLYIYLAMYCKFRPKQMFF